MAVDLEVGSCLQMRVWLWGPIHEMAHLDMHDMSEAAAHGVLRLERSARRARLRSLR